MRFMLIVKANADSEAGVLPTEAELAEMGRFNEELVRREIEAQLVRISVAAHSPLLDPILPEFRALMRTIDLRMPKIPFASNLTGDWVTGKDVTDPEYWVRHFRHSILFADGVDTLLQHDNLVFLEVGPGNILGALTRQNPKAPTQRVVSSMRHPDDQTPDHVYFRTAIGRLWALGVDFDAGKLWGKGPAGTKIPLSILQGAQMRDLVVDSMDRAQHLRMRTTY